MIKKMVYYVVAVLLMLVHGGVSGVVLLCAAMGDAAMLYLMNDKRPRRRMYCYRAWHFFF